MLALICGQGNLPRAIAQSQQEKPLVCVLDGFAPEGLKADIVFRLEELGSLLRRLGQRGVTEICLCGAIRRPRIDPARIDADTLPLVPRLQQALTLGDDGALRIVLEIFQQAGFAIASAHELARDVFPPAGPLTSRGHQLHHVEDAAVGQQTIDAMGELDVGQACVVRAGRVIAREDAAGTDAMLYRLARQRGGQGGGAFEDAPSGWTAPDAAPAEGGILFKAPKPGQDRRADLPVIGPDTADAVAAAGLDGVVVEAGGVMILDRTETLRRMDANGLFLWVRERSG